METIAEISANVEITRFVITKAVFVDVPRDGSENCAAKNFFFSFFYFEFHFSCENPCPKGQHGMMCHKKCQCNNRQCDPQSGECLSENAKIVFDVSHNRSSSIMKLSSDRIKAKHWIPVNGNGKINIRLSDDSKKTLNESAVVDQKDDNKTALIQELNANLSNLTKELKAAAASEKSVVIVNSSIAIHHIHKSGNEAAGLKHKSNDLLTPSTEINSIETDDQDIIYDQHIEGIDEHIIDHDDDGDEEIDGIGGYNDIVHVFAMSSINTTKSVRQLLNPRIVQKISQINSFRSNKSL